MLDIIKIRVRAGKGGDGRVSFLHQKYRPKGGPDGGDGGDGGNIYLQADDNYSDLSHLSQKYFYHAEDGKSGGKNKKSGRAGQDLVILVPPGTHIWQVPADFQLKGNISQKLKQEAKLISRVEAKDTKILIAQAGQGGKGNWRFRSATNQAPDFAEPGSVGQDKILILELKLLADVGLIGLPNAGKSSLLAKLTQAKPKVASYPFTTIQPHLGIFKISQLSVVLIDIPGLIAGASQGKGLGYQFLRHIQRTRLLIHLIEPVFGTDKKLNLDQMKRNYQAIRQELKEYGFGLEKKPEIIVISKADLLSEKDKREIRKRFSSNLISIFEPELLSALVQKVITKLKTLSK